LRQQVAIAALRGLDLADNIVRGPLSGPSTQNGWKAITLSAGARQELFISTAMEKEDLERELRKAVE
jgi:hypothetical protein